MSGTGSIGGVVKTVLVIGLLLAVVIGLVFVFNLSGRGLASLLGVIGLGGAGVVKRRKKKARKRHEEVAAGGPGAIADDNLDLLSRDD